MPPSQGHDRRAARGSLVRPTKAFHFSRPPTLPSPLLGADGWERVSGRREIEGNGWALRVPLCRPPCAFLPLGCAVGPCRKRAGAQKGNKHRLDWQFSCKCVITIRWIGSKHANKQEQMTHLPSFHTTTVVLVCADASVFQKARGGPTGTCRINTSLYELVPEDQSQFDFLIFGKRQESINKITCAHQLGGYSRTHSRGCSQREITYSRVGKKPTGATRPRVRYRALERVISRREHPLG